MRKPTKIKEQKRIARHERLRKALSGTPDRPRLCLHRTINNLQAQLIDDVSSKVLCGLSTTGKEVKIKNGGNLEGAKKFGEVFAALVKSKGFSKVCFDRGGFLYHGRVKAFADAARKGGLEF